MLDLQMQRSDSYYIIKKLKARAEGDDMAVHTPRICCTTDLYWTGKEWSSDRLRATLFTDIEEAHNHFDRIPALTSGGGKFILLNILLTEWAEA